jgi:glycosyltransferase involved in cell wall biosynthesis
MVFNIRPAVYREEWIDYMGNYFSNVQFTAVYVHESDILRGWNIWETRRNIQKIQLPNSLCRFFEIFRLIMKSKPDLILFSGYAYPEHLTGICFAIRKKIPFLLFGDANALERHRVDFNPVYRKMLQYIAGKSFRITYCGIQNKNYWNKLGVKEDKLIPLYFPVNNDRILRIIQIEKEIQELRKQFVKQGEILINFTGRLVVEKGAYTLLSAIQLLDEKYKLIVVGDGKERKNLEEFSSIKGMEKRVHFLGIQENTQVVKYMKASDVVVVPSIAEPFGLVVNEAIVAGKPVIASDATGAAYDLIDPGKNGFIFKAGDHRELANYISQLKDLNQNDIERKRSQVIEDFSFEQNARNLEQIFKEIAGKKQFICS